MNVHTDLKHHIRQFRKDMGLTQSQLANLIGVSKNTISSIETYEFSCSAYVAACLCKVFNCSFSDLFYFE